MPDKYKLSAPASSSLIPEERHDAELSRVYAEILDKITDHELLPGKKLTESELCRQLACSRNTVRNALSLLAHDKIVDLQPNRGAFVHMPDLKEIRDVYNTRIELDCMVTDMLLAMPDIAERLQPLYALIDLEEKATESGDRVSWNRLANAFHVELVRVLGNDVLLEIVNTLCARSALIVAVVDHKNPDKRSNSHSEHREILDLLSAGKRTRLQNLMRRHLAGCLGRLERKIFEEQISG
ncbi:GntR family transcriptional regulator [Neisseria sp.]|uniref:GntR family transcriptional regulator n=1 Tax=Neisseria sp. TaxID=192066 RepID=UPI00359F7B9A